MIDFSLCAYIYYIQKNMRKKWLKFSQINAQNFILFRMFLWRWLCENFFYNFFNESCVKVIFNNITIVILFRSLASFPPWQKSTAGMMACALFHQQNTRWVTKSNKNVLISFIRWSNLQDFILKNQKGLKVLCCKFCSTSTKLDK